MNLERETEFDNAADKSENVRPRCCKRNPEFLQYR